MNYACYNSFTRARAKHHSDVQLCFRIRDVQLAALHGITYALGFLHSSAFTNEGGSPVIKCLVILFLIFVNDLPSSTNFSNLFSLLTAQKASRPFPLILIVIFFRMTSINSLTGSSSGISSCTTKTIAQFSWYPL